MNLPKKFAAISAALFLVATSAHAQVYTAFLSGPAESPPNASPGTGFAQITLSLATHTFSVQVNFTGLTGTTTASHIHAATAVPGAGTAGVATQTPSFSGFPLGVTSGNYSNTFDMTLASTWNAAYISANGGTPAGAEAAFATALANGTAYFNIHTTTFGGGEIRGFLLPAPEPVSTTLFVLGGVAICLARRFRRN
ncbi:MAG: CHRD domain-containing protein [Verrucomicrobiota bacterium]|nr:CHRD domain-containing protein [Verrucomicrobiota bacterium]